MTSEVLKLIENEHLFGTGIGWIDAHLIASARLSKAKIITLDRQLRKVGLVLRLES
ncbi:MAG: PIN domain-containing protein [Spirochaetota bacterium]